MTRLRQAAARVIPRDQIEKAVQHIRKNHRAPRVKFQPFLDNGVLRPNYVLDYNDPLIIKGSPLNET